MTTLLVFAFLFFIGSLLGWGIEVVFRRFFSANNPERKWINPGFCMGPYLPLYGVGLCVLAAMAIVGASIGLTATAALRALLFALMALMMTLIEYISGLMALKWLKVRLWDYTNEWGNIGGLICPKFSLFWAILSALYYFLIHPYILDGLRWLSENLAFFLLHRVLLRRIRHRCGLLHADYRQNEAVRRGKRDYRQSGTPEGAYPPCRSRGKRKDPLYSSLPCQPFVV